MFYTLLECFKKSKEEQKKLTQVFCLECNQNYVFEIPVIIFGINILQIWQPSWTCQNCSTLHPKHRRIAIGFSRREYQQPFKL